MPLLALQIYFCTVLFVGMVLYLAFYWANHGYWDVVRQGIALGLLASPLGFGLPYAILAGVTLLADRIHLPPVLSDWQPILSIPAVLFFLFGPCVGPPTVVGLVTGWYVRRRRV